MKQKSLKINGQEITYILTRKKVKNINLRIGADAVVKVSANVGVPISVIENVIVKNSDFIFNSLEKIKNAPKPQEFVEDEKIREECKVLFREIVEIIYPVFEKMGVEYPVIKIRNMKSRWGSCIPSKNQITLNSRLIIQDRRFVEYVVLHEFCHFIHPNHSKNFYSLVEKLMPDYKARKKLIK